MADLATRPPAVALPSGSASDPGTRKARFFSAAGSANESLAGLRVATAWGYLSAAETEAAANLLRRIIGILWKLTR